MKGLIRLKHPEEFFAIMYLAPKTYSSRGVQTVKTKNECFHNVQWLEPTKIWVCNCIPASAAHAEILGGGGFL